MLLDKMPMSHFLFVAVLPSAYAKTHSKFKLELVNTWNEERVNPEYSFSPHPYPQSQKNHIMSLQKGGMRSVSSVKGRDVSIRQIMWNASCWPYSPWLSPAQHSKLNSFCHPEVHLLTRNAELRELV